MAAAGRRVDAVAGCSASWRLLGDYRVAATALQPPHARSEASRTCLEALAPSRSSRVFDGRAAALALSDVRLLSYPIGGASRVLTIHGWSMVVLRVGSW
mmetsp:Transcript_5336/g.13934  ORF Transcript_5336/g.13934 Transcript_5336/m.13934 type:complete len:99 (-) Transcript_5336:19-315(-)